MTNKIQRRKILIIPFIVFVVSLAISIILEPIRYKTIPLYLFSARGVPLTSRVSCGSKSNAQVEEKFENPPQFDKKSLNGLKEFWHYSFFRACIFEKGYDMEGNRIPESTIENSTYDNFYHGISISLQNEMLITKDNKLDVELDDRRYSSELTGKDNLLEIQVYSDFDVGLVSDVMKNVQRLRPEIMITSKELIGERRISIRYADGDRGHVFVRDKGIIYLRGKGFDDAGWFAIVDSIKINT